MTADQAIFTSMIRQGKSGYHVVARSPGVTESEANALTTWSPSHGGLALDEANPASVNFFPLPSGRYALARSREGQGEYSGRGGRQIYTRAIFLTSEDLQAARYQPFKIYRDAMSLGLLHYRANPPSVLPKVSLSVYHSTEDSVEESRDSLDCGFDPGTLETIVSQLSAGQSVLFAHEGDRAALAEIILDRLHPETVLKMSVSTSLKPSSVRPFRLNLVARK